LGQTRKVKAKIVRVHGFSAHADKVELLQWLSALEKAPKHVFVIHGEKEAADSFADYVRDKKGWDVTVPAYREEIIID
jgi:metallo-beta-lactamase family protein